MGRVRITNKNYILKKQQRKNIRNKEEGDRTIEKCGEAER
jgi:hypothetical protein